MPRIVVRKGYRCKPGKRREVLAALQRVDEAGAAAGWPRGRYLFVESRAPGEPDLEVEFSFESYAEMERLERRLREHLARSARDVPGPGQDLLIEPSATRYLLLLDEGAGRASAPAPAIRAADDRPGAERSVAERPPPRPAAERSAPERLRQPAPDPGPDREPEPEPEHEPPLSLAERRARQLAEARAAMESAERTAGLPEERRSSQRRPAAPRRARPAGAAEAEPDPEP